MTAERSYGFPIGSQLKALFSLAVYLWILGTGVWYVFTSGPTDTHGRVVLGIVMLVLVGIAALMIHRQLELASTIRSSTNGVRLVRLGRDVVSFAWSEVHEVRALGKLGGYEIVSAAGDKSIKVWHTYERTSELRSELREFAGK